MLPINRKKSEIRKPSNFTILGFGFVSTLKKGDKEKYQIVVAKKSWAKLKRKFKKETRKITPKSLFITFLIICIRCS